MNRNRPLLAVLAAGMLLAAGVVGVATLGISDGDADLAPGEVVIRVDGVEVTFAELQMQREVGQANAEVWRQLWAGEDFGMPEEFLRDTKQHADALGTIVDPEDAHLASIASAVEGAAIVAAARELGSMPTEDEFAAQVARHLEFNDSMLPSGEGLGFVRAQEAAARAVLGEERYRDEYLIAQIRQSEARGRLLESLDVSIEDFETAAATVGLRAAQDAGDIWLHPALDVSAEELRAFLGERIALYERLAAVD